MSEVDVSIVILTKNAGPELRMLLEAVYAQQASLPAEVIAIDSGSTDGSVATLTEFPVTLKQISPESFHHARTRNWAAELAKGEIVVFLSQDAIPASKTWLQSLIFNFDDPRVGAVYGRHIPKAQSSIERRDALHSVYGSEKVVKDPALPNRMGYRFYHFSDANAAIRRAVWQATRFPEEFTVFEDLGIAKRILDRGWKMVYEPQAAVFHSHHHTTVGLFKRYFDIGWTLRRLNVWHAPGTRSSLFREGSKLISRKLRSFGKEGGQAQVSALGQVLAKSLGLFLGVHEAYLPLVVKRHLSAYDVFRGSRV